MRNLIVVASWASPASYAYTPEEYAKGSYITFIL